MQNILKSSYFESTWKSPNIKKEMPVVVMPIDILWPNVQSIEHLYNRPFKKNLRNDIEKNGLKNPLICVKLSKKELIQLKKKYGTKLNELPFDENTANDEEYINSIWGGSQRLVLALEMGYTHIDCVICETIANAHIIQKEMRKNYKRLLYSRAPSDKS